ncbi:AAA family ATPase [Luxibacter massiliensis]|uniref:AAA family ATPase n=1 Tax=Luxibacter massiliensis TaxID=2219695 RepID=UPI000F06FA0F|nr:AAA family ATPase [Luxibacter massiliensis]
MQYKIVNLRVKNFKCFDDSKYYEFRIDDSRNPVVLSGPNGFGKTTFFDAIELIFSKNITRLDKAIESKRTNLGKNILLNKADKDGYVILTLKNESAEFVTLFAKILNTNHKLELEKSVFYGELFRMVSTEELDQVLENYEDWTDEINNENIRYRAENFNVYYYVSQAESVHFLKKSISDRKNAMNVLLNTDTIDERISYIDELIGKRNGVNGFIVNDEIISLDNQIKEKIKRLKILKNENLNSIHQEKKNVDIGLFEEDSELFFWDSPKVTEWKVLEIKKAERELENLISFLENKDDYNNFLWNRDVKKVQKSKALEDYRDYRKYILGEKLSLDRINEDLDNWDNKIQIYNSSVMFQQEVPEAANFHEEDIRKLKNLIPQLQEFDFTIIKNISEEILNLKSMLSTNQKVIEKLVNARKALKIANDEHDEHSKVCPFCNTKFSEEKLLNDGFEEVDNLLQKESGDVGERIINKQKELTTIAAEVKKIIIPYIKGTDENVVQGLVHNKIEVQDFINDSGRISNVEKVVHYLENTDFNYQIDNSNVIIEIQRVLAGLIKKIKNEEFENLYAKHEYDKVNLKYREHIENLRAKGFIDLLLQKKKYLESIIDEIDNAEMQEIREKLNVLLVRKIKMEKIRKRLNDLEKVYKGSIERFENLTLEKLRVPLLIYTGKIIKMD